MLHRTPVSRFDTGSTSRAERTPEGFLRVPATIARAGVLVYRHADGTETRELVPPDELQSSTSRKSLALAVVTNDHPLERLVTPANVRRVQVGQVGELVDTEGDFLRANLLVTDRDTMDAIEGGKREVSAGYTCDLEQSAGTWNGERYDAIQRNRRYNHVAIVNSGRAGPKVSLHLDSANAVVGSRIDAHGTRQEMHAAHLRSLLGLREDGMPIAAAPRSLDARERMIAKQRATQQALGMRARPRAGQQDHGHVDGDDGPGHGLAENDYSGVNEADHLRGLLRLNTDGMPLDAPPDPSLARQRMIDRNRARCSPTASLNEDRGE